MRIFLAGATGVIGRPLTRQLLAAGHELVAMTRNEERAAELARQGATPVVCDALDREGLRHCVRAARPEVVIHELTALPRRIDPRKIRTELAATNRLRSEGTRNLHAAALEAGARRFLAQSIAFAYDAEGEGLKTEDDPLFEEPPRSFEPAIQALNQLEETTLSSPDMTGIVLRYGYFYGPGTIYAEDGAAAEDVRRRRFPLVGRGEGVFSFIHVEDAAAATVCALEKGEAGVYNIVDDDPAPVAEWLPEYALELGARPPMRVPRWIARLLVGPYAVHLCCDQRGASNAMARQKLGWSPSRPSWRAGFGVG